MASSGYVPGLDERGERNFHTGADVLLISETYLSVMVHLGLDKEDENV